MLPCLSCSLYMLNVCFCIKNKISKFHFDWNLLFFLSVAQILFIYHGALSIFQYCSIHTLINHTKSKIQKTTTMKTMKTTTAAATAAEAAASTVFFVNVLQFIVWVCLCVWCICVCFVPCMCLCVCVVCWSLFLCVFKIDCSKQPNSSNESFVLFCRFS